MHTKRSPAGFSPVLPLRALCHLWMYLSCRSRAADTSCGSAEPAVPSQAATGSAQDAAAAPAVNRLGWLQWVTAPITTVRTIGLPRVVLRWPLITFAQPVATEATGRTLTQSPSGLFQQLDYELSAKNTEHGLLERSLINAEIMIGRAAKMARHCLKRVFLVPSDLRVPKATWAHVRRQSFSDLVRPLLPFPLQDLSGVCHSAE